MKKIMSLLPTFLFFPFVVFAHDACPELTTLQVWVGYLSIVGFLKIFGIVLGVASIILIFHGIIDKYWNIFWKCIQDIVDIIAHVFSFALIFSGYFVADQYRLWLVLSGCLLFAASIVFTVILRKIKAKNPSRFFSLLFVVWGLTAAAYNLSEIGFIAMMALVAALGFSIYVQPGCYCFGFDDESAVMQGTLSSLAILVLYVLQRHFLSDAPDFIKVFAVGAFWVGSFVGFLGLLIIADKWYIRHLGLNYVWLQLVALSVYSVGLCYGYMSGLNALAGMSGTFLVFYLASKIVEIEKKDKIAWGVHLMVLALFFYGLWSYAIKHEALVKQFMTTSLPG